MLFDITRSGLAGIVGGDVQVAVHLQRLLDEFTSGGGDVEEADFERLDGEVERVCPAVRSVDPFPFRGDEAVWSVVGDEIAAGQRFKGDSPGLVRSTGDHLALEGRPALAQVPATFYLTLK